MYARATTDQIGRTLDTGYLPSDIVGCAVSYAASFYESQDEYCTTEESTYGYLDAPRYPANYILSSKDRRHPMNR